MQAVQEATNRIDLDLGNSPQPIHSTDLPSGEVTFVFTDIEGSTDLLRRLGPGFANVMHTHRRILRDAWVRHGGHEVCVEGDSFLVAFADPAKAVQACIEAQRGLADQRWESGVQVKVRMGIHRGPAQPIDNEYFALAIHRAARVMALAVGQEILASGSVIEAIPVDQRPATVSFGRCKVRDFDHGIELHAVESGDVQLVATKPAGARSFIAQVVVSMITPIALLVAGPGAPVPAAA